MNRSPNNPERLAVKRVIALEGDEVRTLHHYPVDREIVPVGHVWVEGDNVDDHKTMDSNTYGSISKNLIVGQVRAFVYPWHKAGLIGWEDYKLSPRVTPNKVRVLRKERD